MDSKILVGKFRICALDVHRLRECYVALFVNVSEVSECQQELSFFFFASKLLVENIVAVKYSVGFFFEILVLRLK